MIEVAKTLMQKDDGKFLLLKRSSNSHVFPGVWDFPGGKIKSGEFPKDAAVREVVEETTLEITVGSEIAEYRYSDQDLLIHFHVFQVESFEGEIKLSEDHSEFQWLAREDFGTYDLSPVVQLFFS